MKSVICQLAWKLRTTMCFCHSIFIFKIILIFKIMIVIFFQIWFLINSNFKEENEFDWNLISHMRRDSGTINTYLRVWNRRIRGRNPKRRDPKRRPLPETLKERNIKKRGAVNPILAAAPLNPFFLTQSPSTSPPAASCLSKFPYFLAKIINWLLLHACVNLSRMAGLDPAQKKKSGPGLGFRPSRPKLCLLRVCLAKPNLMPWP